MFVCLKFDIILFSSFVEECSFMEGFFVFEEFCEIRRKMRVGFVGRGLDCVVFRGR